VTICLLMSSVIKLPFSLSYHRNPLNAQNNADPSANTKAGGARAKSIANRTASRSGPTAQEGASGSKIVLQLSLTRPSHGTAQCRLPEVRLGGMGSLKGTSQPRSGMEIVRVPRSAVILWRFLVISRVSLILSSSFQVFGSPFS